MARISGKGVFLEISTDGGVTWKQMICLRSSGFDLTTTITSEETQCGVFKDVGNASWGFDFDAVVDTVITSTQISYEDVLALAAVGTAFRVRSQSPATSGTGTSVTSAAVTAAGTGYTTAPTVGFSGGGGTGATAIATVSGGVVNGITITNGGTGYTS